MSVWHSPGDSLEIVRSVVGSRLVECGNESGVVFVFVLF